MPNKSIPDLTPILDNRKLLLVMGTSVVAIVIIDMLMTRSVIPYDNVSGNSMFLLTTIMGYGIGSFVLLGFSHYISKEIRHKSRFLRVLHWSVIVVQISLLAILIIMTISGSYGHLLPRTIFAISSILSVIVMGTLSIKFFSWYRASRNRNFVVLFYGLAALTLSLAIAEDVGTKLVLVERIEEKTIGTNVIDESTFVYKMSEKYDGKIIFKEVNSLTTILYILPNSNMYFYNTLNSIVLPVAFVFRWIASTLLLKNVYDKSKKIPIPLWIILSLPILFYLIGKVGFTYGDFLFNIDEMLEHFFRILFRIGTVGGNILFGLAFLVVAKKVKNSKIKDYLILTGIGDIIVGIALSTSSFEPTFGVGASSLVLLSSYLFFLGLYSSAVSISQDIKIRQVIRDTVLKQSKLIYTIGSSQLLGEIEKEVFSVVHKEKKRLTEHTGFQPSFTYSDTKKYLDSVLKETKIIQDTDEIIKTNRNMIIKSTEFALCTKPADLLLAYHNYFMAYKTVSNQAKNGNHKGIRIVTSLQDKDDSKLITKFLEQGIGVKHVKDLPPISFALSENHLIGYIQKKGVNELMPNLMSTNEPIYLNQFFSIFEELWNNGIDAIYRIRDIEQGIVEQGIEVIQNPDLTEKLLGNVIKSSKEEIVAIISSVNLFCHGRDSKSFRELIKKININKIRVRLLLPDTNEIKEDLDKLLKAYPDNLMIRFMESTTHTKISIIVIDKIHSFTIESKDDDQLEIPTNSGSTFANNDIMGLSTYSNSKPTVSTYFSIFENFWRQTELNEKLKVSERMQVDFINIAAHELRTPIQPILGSTYVLKNKLNDESVQSLVETINRNALRLKKLADNILDVTKIQGNSFELNKVRFDISDVILENINIYSKSVIDKDIKFKHDLDQDLFVDADKNALSRVISNLISNSIKFLPMEGGTVLISAHLQKINSRKNVWNNKKGLDSDYGYNDSSIQEVVVVDVKDTGVGIDLDILPRLFTKFATKSFQGIGLGLFIAKGIVESHNGRIWASNNTNREGATFSFYIPFDNNK